MELWVAQTANVNICQYYHIYQLFFFNSNLDNRSQKHNKLYTRQITVLEVMEFYLWQWMCQEDMFVEGHAHQPFPARVILGHRFKVKVTKWSTPMSSKRVCSKEFAHKISMLYLFID